MKTIFRKTILSTLPLGGVLRVFALVAALGIASLPFVNASAAGENDPTPPPQGQITNERLEWVWARQLRIYERIGKVFERQDTFTSRVQQLIDRARANGRDVTAVQAALDAFESALKDAHHIYESTKGTVNAHQGFDSNGQVTNSAKAQETVQAMREKLKEIKAAMNGTGKALHEAIKAFREANPRPQPTPSATSG